MSGKTPAVAASAASTAAATENTEVVTETPAAPSTPLTRDLRVESVDSSIVSPASDDETEIVSLSRAHPSVTDIHSLVNVTAKLQRETVAAGAKKSAPESAAVAADTAPAGSSPG